jgi:hypothetical protein
MVCLLREILADFEVFLDLGKVYYSPSVESVKSAGVLGVSGATPSIESAEPLADP